MTPLFDPKLVTLVKEGHEYYVEVDGTTKKFPSLSYLLRKTGLAHEYGDDIPKWVLERAARTGDETHAIAEKMLKNEAYPEPSSAAKPYSDAAWMLIKKHDMKPEMAEVSLYNPVFDYCCTVDFVGLVDGKPAIVDWKTTSQIYWQAGFQLAGQALSFRNPESFDLYIGDLRSGLLQPFSDKRYLTYAKTAFQLYNDVQDLDPGQS